MSTGLFLNTNIFIYTAGAQHPLKVPCVQILADIGTLQAQFSTGVEVVQEILHRYISIGRQNDAIIVANHVLQLVPVIHSLESADMQRAIQICAVYPKLTARDAIHTATMLNRGILHIVSADTHFDSVTGIQRIEPLTWNTTRLQYL